MSQLAIPRTLHPAGASRQVASTHNLPPHKMYDPELGMWTFPYRAVCRVNIAPYAANANSGIFVFDMSGGSASVPETASQILYAFTPSNGNMTPLQVCIDGYENNTDTTAGWMDPAKWDTQDLLPDMSNITDQHRVVNASLKVTYTGNNMANSGVVYVYQGPHIPAHRSELVSGTSEKLSVAQMVARIKSHPRTKVYDTASFRGGKIFHVERGAGRRTFRSPYKARAPDATAVDRIWPSDGDQPSFNDAGTDGSNPWVGGYPRYMVPPTMQALYVFAEGVSIGGANFSLEAVQHAEIQIDPDATTHLGLATPPNNHTPEPDAGSRTLHLKGEPIMDAGGNLRNSHQGGNSFIG